MRHGNQSWPEMERADREQIVALLPLGSMEQHGHHLPLLTDTLQVTAIAESAAARLGDRAALLPTLWVGASDHHLDFPGTVSLSVSLYTQVIKGMVRSLLRGGFRRIFCLNGHGGNEVPGTQALTEMVHESDLANAALLAFSSWWRIGSEAVGPEDIGMETPSITHACEYETSLMLHLHPDLVATDLAQASPPVLTSTYFHSEEGGAVKVAHRFNRLSKTGSMGRPDLATPDKGAALFAAVVGAAVDCIEEFATWSTFPETRPSTL